MKRISLLIVLSFLGTILSAQVTPTTKVTGTAVVADKTITATVPGSSQLSGLYSAPSGISIVLQNNGKNDLVLTAYESSDPDVGGATCEDGRDIVFVSSATFAGSTGKHRQLFWRDRNEGTTKLISSSAIGEEGNGDSYYPAISGDGKSVAFESYSSNPVEVDINGLCDVFVWQAATEQNKAVASVSGCSVGRAALSQKGGYVVFGIGGKLDSRFESTGIFANCTGVGPCLGDTPNSDLNAKN